MNETPTLAAIDVGSNAIKMAVCRVREDGTLRELETCREALRLGEDAFIHGAFQPPTIRAAIEVFRQFSSTLKKHDVDYVRAVATSATRESANGRELIETIAARTGVAIEVIDGLEEARLVTLAVSSVFDLSSHNALLIDMGGGSVEITITRRGTASGCETLRIGPVRLLEDLRKSNRTEHDVPAVLRRFGGIVEDLVDAQLDGEQPDLCIGTGGSIQSLARLRVTVLGRRKTRKIMLGDLESFIPISLATPIDDRIRHWGLKPDRADVIAIAAQVLHMIADEARVRRIDVPQVGLRQGILIQMMHDFRESERLAARRINR